MVNGVGGGLVNEIFCGSGGDGCGEGCGAFIDSVRGIYTLVFRTAIVVLAALVCVAPFPQSPDILLLGFLRPQIVVHLHGNYHHHNNHQLFLALCYCGGGGGCCGDGANVCYAFSKLTNIAVKCERIKFLC